VLHVDVIASDTPSATARLAFQGHRRVLVLECAGGPWAHSAAKRLSDLCARFVEADDVAFSTGGAQFVNDLRRALAHLERQDRMWCAAEFVALELTPSQCRILKIGAMRVWAFGSGARSTLGTEDAFIASEGSLTFSTAQLIPDVRWVTTDAGEVLRADPDAERMAESVRESVHEIDGMSSLAVTTHPFWTEEERDVSSIASVSAPAAVTQQMRELVERSRAALAVVIRIEVATETPNR
jgi:hypothetical protein